MPKHLMMLMIGLFFGTGGGFLLAAANDATLTGHDHANHGSVVMDGHDHSKMLDLVGVAPTVDLTLEPEGSGAWTLYIDTKNFRFAPENVNATHVDGEGHAHIYIDGEKFARVYGPWFHVANLPEGAKELRVTLNANSHETLAIDGQPIDVSVRLDR